MSSSRRSSQRRVRPRGLNARQYAQFRVEGPARAASCRPGVPPAPIAAPLASAARTQGRREGPWTRHGRRIQPRRSNAGAALRCGSGARLRAIVRAPGPLLHFAGEVPPIIKGALTHAGFTGQLPPGSGPVRPATAAGERRRGLRRVGPARCGACPAVGRTRGPQPRAPQRRASTAALGGPSSGGRDAAASRPEAAARAHPPRPASPGRRGHRPMRGGSSRMGRVPGGGLTRCQSGGGCG